MYAPLDESVAASYIEPLHCASDNVGWWKYAIGKGKVSNWNTIN